MLSQRLAGKTVKELVEIKSMFWYPIRVFLLENEEDKTGRLLISTYTFQQILDQCPAAAEAKVVSAENYFGETILRISDS